MQVDGDIAAVDAVGQHGLLVVRAADDTSDVTVGMASRSLRDGDMARMFAVGVGKGAVIVAGVDDHVADQTTQILYAAFGRNGTRDAAVSVGRRTELILSHQSADDTLFEFIVVFRSEIGRSWVIVTLLVRL